jgi:hypothetical protein
VFPNSFRCSRLFFFERADLLQRHPEKSAERLATYFFVEAFWTGYIVMTLAPSLTLTILQLKPSKAGSIVCRITEK